MLKCITNSKEGGLQLEKCLFLVIKIGETRQVEEDEEEGEDVQPKQRAWLGHCRVRFLLCLVK